MTSNDPSSAPNDELASEVSAEASPASDAAPVPDATAPDDAAWPTCPDCEKRRLAVCPFCQTASVEFSPADANFLAAEGEAADDDAQPASPRLGLICSTCDEPFQPKFLRRCEWCSHDFGEGIVREPAPRPIEQESVFNNRAAFVMGAIAVIFIALMIYFALVVQ